MLLPYVNSIDSRRGVCLREHIYRGCSLLEPNSLPASHASVASSSRVNCKVSGCREIWKPRAAAGIRAIHRMQICAAVFLGGEAILPTLRRSTAFITLILASSLHDGTRLRPLTLIHIASIDSNPLVRTIG